MFSYQVYIAKDRAPIFLGYAASRADVNFPLRQMLFPGSYSVSKFSRQGSKIYPFLPDHPPLLSEKTHLAA